jgi:hypothetical protein
MMFHSPKWRARLLLLVAVVAASNVLASSFSFDTTPLRDGHPTIHQAQAESQDAASHRSISGQVSGPSGAVEQARVTIFDAETNHFQETRSDSSGNFAFGSVPEGSYKLGASVRGLEYRESLITIAATDVSLDVSLGLESHPGEWVTIGDAGERLGGTNSAVLLADGRILYCHDTLRPIIFDPVSSQITRLPASQSIQGGHAVSLLQDGSVIYVGGTNRAIFGPGTKDVKRYDPSTNQWDSPRAMNGNRWYPTLVPLSDGRFLIVGGGGIDNPRRVKTAEIFNSMSNTFTPTQDMIVLPGQIGNEFSPSALLHSGEVLMTFRPPQLFNPRTGSWRRAADFTQGNRNPDGDHPDHEIQVMHDGNVVALGYRNYSQRGTGSLTEIYSPSTDSWRLGANFSPLRQQVNSVHLPDKRVLVMNGYKEDRTDSTPVNQWGFMKISDLYDYELNSWRRLSDMNNFREYHATPVLVPDGRVIIVGGEGKPGEEPQQSVIESFSPPYLFRGIRPEIMELSGTSFKRGDQLEFAVEKTASLTSVALIGTSANTHFMDARNARYIDLEYLQAGRQVSANLPSDSNRLPSGFYLLVALVDDVPSVAKVIRIEV